MASQHLRGRYWKLNPRLTESIALDRASKADREKMNFVVESYLKEQTTKNELESIVDDIMKV